MQMKGITKDGYDRHIDVGRSQWDMANWGMLPLPTNNLL